MYVKSTVANTGTLSTAVIENGSSDSADGYAYLNTTSNLALYALLVIDGLFEENEELETNLNEQIQSNIELKKQLLAYEAGNIFAHVSEGLSDVEVSKFASLSEGVDFESLDQYQEKLNILKSSYFSTAPTTHNMLVEETTNKQITQNISSSMNAYMSTLDRIAKQNKI